MTDRIRIRGNPWFITKALTGYAGGDAKVCDVHCLTQDGRYFTKALVTLKDPRRFVERVGRAGDIDPAHWQQTGVDREPEGHSFRDLADANEWAGRAYD